MSTNSNPIVIDIVSDIVCPWCIVGYKRLEKALSHFPQQSFEIRWHPFELNPNMPEEGQDIDEHIAEKYGATPEQNASNRRNLSEVAESLNFELNYPPGKRIVNTFRAHQLLHWAGTLGRQTELQMALFEAYFTVGKDVNQVPTLLDAVTAAGLDERQAAEVLQDERFAEQVREEEQTWLRRGVRAVPTFVLADRVAVSGAREPEELKGLLEEALAPRI